MPTRHKRQVWGHVMDDVVRGSGRAGEADNNNHTRQLVGQILRMVSSGERPGEVPLVYVLSVEVRQPEPLTGKLRLLTYATRRAECGHIPRREDWGALLDAAVEEVEGNLPVPGCTTGHQDSCGSIQFWH